MRKVIVTGGAGFIGANYVRHCVVHRPEDQITVVDSLTYAGNLSNIRDALDAQRVNFVCADINETERITDLIAELHVDTIVHFAAESHVDRSIDSPDMFVTTNVLGTCSLLKAATTSWRGRNGWSPDVRFHHVSTDEVYGSLSPDEAAFCEETRYAPNSPYAATKASADHMVRAYHHTYGLPATTSNCSNNYGPYHFPEKLIPLAIVNALEGRSIPVYGDGRQVRDWLFVEDHCRAITQVLERGVPGETYNIGGRAERTNIDVIRTLCATIDAAFATDPSLGLLYPNCPASVGTTTASLITSVKDRPGHDRRYAIDPAKAESELGYRAAFTFEEGLRATVAWYLGNRPWWLGVMDGSYREWLVSQYGQEDKA